MVRLAKTDKKRSEQREEDFDFAEYAVGFWRFYGQKVHNAVVRLEKSVESETEAARRIDCHNERVFALVLIIACRNFGVYAVNFVFFHDLRDVRKCLVFTFFLVVYAITDGGEDACRHNV